MKSNWSNIPPESPGWYWYQATTLSKPKPVELRRINGVIEMFFGYEGYKIESLTGQWWPNKLRCHGERANKKRGPNLDLPEQKRLDLNTVPITVTSGENQYGPQTGRAEK